MGYLAVQTNRDGGGNHFRCPSGIWHGSISMASLLKTDRYGIGEQVPKAMAYSLLNRRAETHCTNYLRAMA